MTVRLLLDVLYRDEYCGQCLPEIQIENWNALSDLLGPPDWGIAYATNETMRSMVNNVAQEVYSSEWQEKLTSARVIQIIPIC